MPSTSPGNKPSPSPPSDFVQILPGAPTSSLQALTSFPFRHKRYVAYASGRQLNILVSPTKLVQAIQFKDELVAVATESQTGKIAVASKSEVCVLEPVAEGWTKVWWERSLRLRREDAGDEAGCLSWGSEGEVLVGGSRHLALFSTVPSSRTGSPAASPVNGEFVEERKPLWSKHVSSPVQSAAFSPTAGLIATRGRYDRLVKIWRRLSFEEGLFDYMYLPHPGVVTHLEWRPLNEHSGERRGSGISWRHEEESEVLYTIASDGVLRVWRTGGIHDLEILVLHTTVDLASAIPQSPSLTTKGHKHAQRPTRYAFVIPSDSFCAAVTAATAREADKISYSLEHLKEVASKSPDVVVTLDDSGRMSAWGLQSIGHKRRPGTPGSTQAFHIAHAEGLNLHTGSNINMRFQAWFAGSTLQILAHSFDGHVCWWEGDAEIFFSPSAAGRDRLSTAADCSGHLCPVDGLHSSSDGSSLVSWTLAGEVAALAVPEAERLARNKTFHVDIRVLDALPLVASGCVLTVHEKHILLWDGEGSQLCRVNHGLDSSDGLHLRASSNAKSVLVFDGAGQGAFVDIRSQSIDGQPQQLEICRRFAITTASEGGSKPLHLIYAGDVPGRGREDTMPASRFVWTDEDGNVVRTTLSPSGKSISDELHEHNYASFGTGMESPCMLASNYEVAAVASADGRDMVIVELKDGYVEHRETLSDPMRHLQCYSTSPRHNLLAVGFDEGVGILAQSRYEYYPTRDTWTTIKQISIAGIGLRISSIEWLASGTLAVGTGNGLLLSSNTISHDDLADEVKDRIDLYHDNDAAIGIPSLSSYLKKPVPIWHPSFLAHLVRHGKPGVGLGLLRRLSEKLKFWSEGEYLHPLLEAHPENVIGSTTTENISDNSVRDLQEQLDEKDLPGISKNEQVQLKHVLEALVFVSEHLKGLDMCAIRYLFSWKLQLLQMARQDGTQLNGVPHAERSAVPTMNWREIAFASHSTTQQPLLDILVLHYDNKLDWNIVRSLGVTAWLSDKEALEQVFESLAQSAYRQTSPPDPTNASLYFLALHKKPTLLGLWRIATWHKEQRATMNFLKRDFSLPEAKTAAKKNAYALMGRRRFEYAAAFFLLADDAASTVSLLAGQCEDAILAIAIARLYSGDGSPTLRKLLEDRLMPRARQQGDRWLMSWCHSFLMQRREAADALVKPLDGVRSWHQDDSTTLVLYQQLRGEASKHEYQAVLRAARVLRRMGMWLLALELVINWKFPPPAVSQPAQKSEDKATTNGIHHEPASALDDLSEPIVNEKAAREAQAAELLRKLKVKKEKGDVTSEKSKPTQFKEPDANSLLDSFGF